MPYGGKSTISELDRRYTAGREVRRVFENEWTLLLAYGLGHQWIRVDGSGRIYGVGNPEERVTLTDNRIRPASRTNIARKTKTKPMWQGIPADRSDEEVQRARVRTDVFEHYWRELEATRRLRLALWYVDHCGKGFWKITWDPNKGETEQVVGIKGGDVLLDQNGRPVNAQRVQSALGSLNPAQYAEVVPQLEDREVTHGDAELALKTPFEIVVDPLATDEGLITAEYLVEEAIYSPAKLRTWFPHAQHDYDEDASPAAGALEGRFPGLVGYLDRSREHRGASGRRGVKVREYWSLPGVDGPRGKHCVWTASGVLLVEEENPYPFLPYTEFNGLPAGRFWSDAPLKDLLSPQTERNKTKSQIAENAERFGNPARMRSAESKNLQDDWQGLPGEEIVYQDTGTPGSVPQFLVPPNMPQYVIDQLEENRSAIATISGQNEVSQGIVPQGVTAASAISQLIEQNDTMIGPDIDEVAGSLLDAGKKLLWCVRRFAHNDRIARIAGQDADWDIAEFTGQDLGDASGDAVTIGSTIATSIAVKQSGIQWVVNTLIQNGQAPPPRELRRVLRDYEVGGLEHLFGSIDRSQTQVVEEHRQMMQLAGQLAQEGVQPEMLQQLILVQPIFPTNTFDDDQLHVEEHQDFQRSSRYSTEVKRNPLFSVLMEAHVGEHRTKLQTAANNAAAAQMIMNDPGGEPTLDPGALGGALGGAPSGALPSPAGEPSPNGAP